MTTLTGRFLRDDGSPAAGVLRFYLPFLTTNTVSGVRSEPANTEVTLDDTGAFSLVLAPTDDPDVEPSPRYWLVTEFIDGRTRVYPIDLTTEPDPQDLADLMPGAYRVLMLASDEGPVLLAGGGPIQLAERI